ncbi:DUF47 domain-containing protein [Heyndrickxia acidicola]|uniref:DUF47 family protein n=1 Tax=Heyndrickxia acidicola TaxID=209389 RepID=A0ABU6MN39_9BACI|nr:DUF47 family protein [Heyndrickxia acidicola]MED1206071.1 DUF47 family protein [Heyndrickxia acidicola]
MPILERKDKFSVMLGNITENLSDSVKFLTQATVNNEEDLKALSVTLKDFESKGDSFIHELIVELHKSFITPYDREDILQLAMSLDDILDGIDQAAALMEMYGITQPTVYMKLFVEALFESCQEINASIDLLSRKKLRDIRSHTIRIKELESRCDEILRDSVKELFELEKNPIAIIQLKEVYENLEQVSDYCQKVANVLETVVMKNA